MKKYFLMLAAVLFTLSACIKQENPEPDPDKDKTEKPEDKPDDNKPEEKPDDTPKGLTLKSDAVVNLGAESEQITIVFDAGSAWTVETDLLIGDADFLVLKSTSGEAGAGIELKVVADGLPEEEEGRAEDLIVKAGSDSFTVRIFQGVVFFIASEDPYFGTAGGSLNFDILSNTEFTITTYEEAYPWITLTYDENTMEGSINVAANQHYDNRAGYVKFTVPAIQVPVYDDEGNDTGETKDMAYRLYIYQDGNLQIAWVRDFFWTMFSEGGRHSIALIDNYVIINAPIDPTYGTGGLMVFNKQDGSYVGNIDSEVSFTGITTDDAGNIVLSAGGDFPINEETWELMVEDQTPLTVYVIEKAQFAKVLAGQTELHPTTLITYPDEFYGYGLSNIRVTGDVTKTAVIDLVSAAYQEGEPTSYVLSWQVSGGATTNAPTRYRTVPSSMSIWTPNDLVAKHTTNDVDGPLFYMGYDGNYQLWYANSMSTDWQDVLDSGSTWVEGYQCLDIIEWNGHKYLGLIAETYFAWYGWGSLPSFLWIINIDDPLHPLPIAQTPVDITGTEGSWQYGATADLEMVVEGNDLAVYCVDAGISTYHKIVYPKL